MAILSRFVRDSRFEEIAGCPLSSRGAEDESSCSACSYNVINPGQPRLGCVSSTGLGSYTRAMQRLQATSGEDHAQLEAILEAQRHSGKDVGLEPAQLQDVLRIAQKWWGNLGGDSEEQRLVLALLQFARAALESREPVRILA